MSADHSIGVLGLDMSSSSTGICAGGDCLTVKAKGDTLTRARIMRREIVPYALAADLIVTEGIGTRFTKTAIAISYVHALVRDQINDETAVHTVAPATLKQFATGKGNADKDVMLLAAVRNGSKCENNDEADAWWLWALGCHLIGYPVVDDTAYRQLAVAKVAAA